MTTGRFITLEGGEGTGKSTQIRRLVKRLEGLGLKVLSTREPGGSPGGEVIRELLVKGAVDRWSPMAEALLFYAARVDHIERVIKPALAEGTWVVCDRFSDSTFAYQGVAGKVDMDRLQAIHDKALEGFEPDLTLVLDLPVLVGLERAIARADGEDRFEQKDDAFHEALRQAFLDIAKANPKRVKVVDANQNKDDVEADIYAAVAAAFVLAGEGA